jgi:hypothetical protein
MTDKDEELIDILNSIQRTMYLLIRNSNQWEAGLHIAHNETSKLIVKYIGKYSDENTSATK